MKLLVLDDDIQIREGICKGIDWKSLGFDEVESAGDGFAGILAAREMAPDIVLSDVRMPGMDGLEFLRQVKELFPRIKVFLLSGYDDFEYLQKAIRYGADGYELKPVKLQNLLRLVEEAKEKIAAESPGKAPERFSPVYDSRIGRALEYIHTNLAANLDTRTLGEVLQMSPNYFSALFKKETGVPFSSFVNKARLEASAYLLEHTDQRVYEIADNTGFRDMVYFSQLFKKLYGCSPREYRKTRAHVRPV
jgi:two-component system response regulator YesN